MAMKATSAKTIAFRWLPIPALMLILGSTWVSMCLSSTPAHAQPLPTVRVTVSPGSEVTPDDVRIFNEAWMSRATREEVTTFVTSAFTIPDEPRAWISGQHMEAMVRMYDLTHDRAYLDHLRELSRVVLGFRDDHRTDRPHVEDPFRGRVMPAWGAHRVSSGYLHHTSIDIAGVYAYPIAAFARIVAEHPPLWGEYGAEAIEFANAVLETLKGFSDELSGPRDAPASSYYVYPRTYRTLLTESTCNDAHTAAKNGIGPDAGTCTNPEAKDRCNGFKKSCNDNRKVARYPAAHNQNHALLMAMIEVWRAVDSSFYAQRAGQNPLAEEAKTFFPMRIKRTFRWFARNTRSPEGSAGRLEWNGADGLPPEFVGIEDTSHGELSMRYLGVLHRNSDRINRALPPGQAPIELSQMRRQLRRTFLRVGRGHDLAHRVDGSFRGGERDWGNLWCNGWLDLTGADARVYDKCREVTLRVVSGQQLYLSIGGHASLLANKPTSPAPTETIVPDVRDISLASAAAAIRSAGLVPRFTGNGTWVESQSPPAGAVVAHGSTVTCAVRSGPRP